VRIFVAVVSLSITASQASAVNLLVNGDFELGNLNSWQGYGVFGAVRTGIFAGVSPEQGNSYLLTNTSFSHYDGGIYQQVSLGAGMYTLTGFSYGFNNVVNPSNPPNRPSDHPSDTWGELRVDPTGGTNPSGGSVLNAGHVGGIAGWLPSAPFTFTLASPATVTIFAHEHATFDYAGNYTGWDDIQLNPVPEPAAVVLFGLASLSLLRRHRMA
jgi:hypothetical protein